VIQGHHKDSYKMERHFALCFGNSLVAVSQPITADTRIFTLLTIRALASSTKCLYGSLLISVLSLVHGVALKLNVLISQSIIMMMMMMMIIANNVS